MLKALRRWLKRGPVRFDFHPVQAWAEQQGWAYTNKHPQAGFSVEPPAERHWRMEWGPSHRRYLGEYELRLRGHTGIDPHTFGVVMPRDQLELLDRELFTQYVDGVETQANDQTPEEVRWLAVSPRVDAKALGPVGEVLAAVGNVTPWMQTWLAGPAGQQLSAWLQAPASPPLVLIAQHGRLTMRMGMHKPDLGYIADAIHLFELALAEARKLGDHPPAA
jgi:hypothetical protein